MQPFTHKACFDIYVTEWHTVFIYKIVMAQEVRRGTNFTNTWRISTSGNVTNTEVIQVLQINVIKCVLQLFLQCWPGHRQSYWLWTIRLEPKLFVGGIPVQYTIWVLGNIAQLWKQLKTVAILQPERQGGEKWWKNVENYQQNKAALIAQIS